MADSLDLHICVGKRPDGTRGVSVVSDGVEAFGMVLTPGQARTFASLMCRVADEVEHG